MSYTITAKMINVEDFSEQDVNQWAQDVGLLKVVRPNAVNPQYLLLLKSNEVIILDRYGNKRLEMTLDYTAIHCAINNNGEFAISSDYDVYLYNSDGSLRTILSFGNKVQEIYLGTDYLTVLLQTSPAQLYIYKLSDLSYSNFSFSVNSAGACHHTIDEDGDHVWIIRTSGGNCYIALIKQLSQQFDKNTGKSSDWVDAIRCRPDGIIAVGESHDSGRIDIIAVRNDGVLANILSYSVSSPYATNISFDINATKIMVIKKGSATLRKLSLNVDIMSLSEVTNITLTENAEAGGLDVGGCNDATPDGKYHLIQLQTKCVIVDYDDMSIKKEITKSTVDVPLRMLAVEVT